MESITVAFKAKRVTQFEGGYGYSVPDIAPHHVVTPVAQQGMRARLWLQTSDADMRKRRRVSALKRAGLDGYSVTESDAERLPGIVAIEPIGSGFMARVTLQLEV